MDKSMFDIRPVPTEVPCGECGAKGFPEWVAVSSRFAGRFVGLIGLQLCDECDASSVHLVSGSEKDQEKLRVLGEDFQARWRARSEHPEH